MMQALLHRLNYCCVIVHVTEMEMIVNSTKVSETARHVIYEKPTHTVVV